MAEFERGLFRFRSLLGDLGCSSTLCVGVSAVSPYLETLEDTSLGSRFEQTVKLVTCFSFSTRVIGLHNRIRRNFITPSCSPHYLYALVFVSAI